MGGNWIRPATLHAYDGLSRLTGATITNTANGQDYSHTFAYDILGNITNKSDVGAYTYAQTDYASPHAVTQAGGKTYGYDQNGNLSTDGTWAHAWDHKDRLISSAKTEATVNYAYDEAGTRVTKTNATSGKVTTYVSDLLDIEADQEKLAFYANGLKIATQENTGIGSGPECTVPTSGDWTVTADCTISSFKTVSGNITINPAVTLTISPTGVLTLDLTTKHLLVKDTAKLIVKQGGVVAQTGAISSPLPGGTQGGLVFHHPDHLSSASIDTDESGVIVQLTDYYPYGDSRIEESTTAFHNDYTYTGKERDEDTELLYYEARYYDSTLGRFLSLDPWGGDITDPQSLNKYAYVRNNPLKYRDPDGRSYVGFTDEEVAFYERVYMGQFIGPLTLEQSKKLEMYKMQRSLKQAMANMAKFDGILFDMMESEEEKARENYAANYDQLLSGAEKNTFTDQDFLNHAKLLDKTAQEGVGGIVGLAGGSKGAKVVGEKITGYTKHGINRAISKDNVGVKTSAIVDALRNPVKTIQQTGNRMVMIGKDAVVVLNKAGKVITTRATNRNGQRNPR